MYYLGPATEYKKDNIKFKSDRTSDVINAYYQLYGSTDLSCFLDLGTYIKSKFECYYKNIGIGGLEEQVEDGLYAYQTEWEFRSDSYSIFDWDDDKFSIIDKMIDVSIDNGGPCCAGFSNNLIIVETSDYEEYGECIVYSFRITYIHWDKNKGDE